MNKPTKDDMNKWTDEPGQWVAPSERVRGIFGIWRMIGAGGFNPSVEVSVGKALGRDEEVYIAAFLGVGTRLTSEKARQLSRVLADAADELDRLAESAEGVEP